MESVAWIAERKDVLSAFFFLLTLWAYVRYADEFKAQSAERGVRSAGFKIFYALALLFFALGLMSKPMLVTLPFVLLLLDFWPLERMSRLSWRRLAVEKAPFLAMSAACCAAAIWAQQRSNAIASAAEIPLWHRLGHVMVSYFGYIGMLVFPRGLAIFYPYPLHEQTALVIGGAAGLALLSALAAASARRRPWLAVGWLWFLGMLVPVIGLVQVGDQALADRYTYLPAIGLFIIAAWAGLNWPCVFRP